MMSIDKNRIAEHNQRLATTQQRRFERLAEELPGVADIVNKLVDFQVAIPSWALGTGGTRFGRFSGGGEPRTLEEQKIGRASWRARVCQCGKISVVGVELKKK